MELYFKLRDRESHVVERFPDGKALGHQPIRLIMAMTIIGNYVYRSTQKDQANEIQD